MEEVYKIGKRKPDARTQKIDDLIYRLALCDPDEVEILAAQIRRLIEEQQK